MLQLRDIKARIPRLRQRVEGLEQEIKLWQQTESVLLPLEQRAYLIGLQEMLMGLERALVVLQEAAQRIEALGLPELHGPGA